MIKVSVTTNISDAESSATETVTNTKEDNQKPVSLRRSAKFRPNEKM